VERPEHAGQETGAPSKANGPMSERRGLNAEGTS
jgi:hypothetical protein